MMKFTNKKNVLVLIVFMLLIGIMTVTALTFKKIYEWKTIMEYLINEAPMSENVCQGEIYEAVKAFAETNTRKLDDWMNLLIVGLSLGIFLILSLMAILIFLFIFKKSNEVIPDIELGEPTLNTKEEDETSGGSGCILKKTFEGFGFFKTIPKTVDIGTQTGQEELSA